MMALQNRNGGLARRINLMRANRLAPSMVFLKREVECSGERDFSRLNLAVGLSSPHLVWGEGHIKPWISIKAIPIIVQYYVDSVCLARGTTNQDRKKAMLYGEIAAAWTLPQDCTENDVKEARGRILHTIRRNPPNPNRIAAAFNHCIRESLHVAVARRAD
ncbi:hypothetical protein QE152_g25831 [Popillia japonica]|uniref:Uncharacterized protein n=1 Tax=Popillia japonica TaxID=7064 RepID=A0AAW1JYT0_POPJA